MLKLFLNYLIFPGLLFAICAGLIAWWLERKISARLQWRVGPPWHQNFTDIFKLLGKEIILPKSSGMTFLLAPFLGLLSLGLAADILGQVFLPALQGFNGDLIVILYLLTMPAVAAIIGAASSRNPLASIGASREMKLVLAYELPFILSIIAVIIKTQGAIQIGAILNYQQAAVSNVASWSGAIAFAVALICTQAKLGMSPFEISEAEQEIMGGTLIEYSGLPLAAFKMTKAALIYLMPVFLITLFLGKDTSALFTTIKFLGILIVFVLIKNTNPRLRIDQALRFFWGPVTLLAVLAILLAIVGR